MTKGNILEVTIESYGMSGEGIARVDGMVIFIPQALVGETVKVQITQAKKKFCNAKVIKLIKGAKERVTPKCPTYFRCGCCEMQHIDYNRQLEIKKEHVKNCLLREGISFDVDDTIASPNLYGYRNKVQLPLTTINNQIVAGYFKKGSHNVVPFDKSDDISLGDCCLHTKDFQNIIDLFIAFANKYKLTTYNEETHKGLLRHLCIRKVSNSFAIVIVINGKELPHYMELINNLNNIINKYSLYISINTKNTNVIYGEKLITLYGNDDIDGEILGVKVKVSPLSFMQINDSVRDLIYSRVGEIVKESNNATVFDLFSGVGIMSNIFAKFADKVIGLEIVPEAVKNANLLAKLNNNQNKITNILGDATIELPKYLKSHPMDSDSIVVVDPPRKGCGNIVMQSLADSKPNKIIYISCNPISLAQDLKLLAGSYDIKSVTPYDMFPHTAHVETLVVLEKQ